MGYLASLAKELEIKIQGTCPTETRL